MSSEFTAKGYSIVEQEAVKDLIIFDKAKWHFQGDFPKELDIFQAYVPTGFYIGWLIVKHLIDEDEFQENRNEIRKVRSLELSGPKFYELYLDGVFDSNFVNSEGLRFTEFYFDFENGKYLSDLKNSIAFDLPSLYQIEDNVKNYLKISEIINERFLSWRDNL